MKIKIDHIAKIEGHAGFVGHIVKNQMPEKDLMKIAEIFGAKNEFERKGQK